MPMRSDSASYDGESEGRIWRRCRSLVELEPWKRELCEVGRFEIAARWRGQLGRVAVFPGNGNGWICLHPLLTNPSYPFSEPHRQT